MPDKKLQILVVEDDAIDRMTIKRELKSSGIVHDLYFAEDHETGKQATDGKEYDCIFLDYNLPGGSGLELLKTIRGAGNQSPIIIVTGQGDEKIAVEVMKNGANDYIPKILLTGDGLAQSIRYMVYLKECERRQRDLENQLKATQKQLETVVANAPIIVFSLDENGMFHLFEGQGLNSLGINQESIKGQLLENLDNLPILYSDFKNSLQGEKIVSVNKWQERYFEIFYSPVSENNICTGVIGVATDITIHKNAEEELRRAKLMAEDTAKIKEQFLANMSHEIRTPMNGIIGLTRILINSGMTGEQRRYLDSIKTCTDNLLVIINDILDFSKIESGKMNFESVPFSINDLARHTIELFQPKADEKDLKLIFQTDPGIDTQLLGDPTRLSQILNNLVSNAIKFTERGNVKTSIAVFHRNEENISLRFEIKDSGIGIPEKSLATIFDSFTQASSDTTRKFGGTGLGLTIVKKLIELQGGVISVSSTPGVGTNFNFTLTFPLVKEGSEISSSILPAEENLPKLRILIAEDNKINQLIVKKLFADWETPVEFADNGKIAIEKLLSSHFDLILMDIQMPEMDGYEAASYIRTMLPENLKNIPVIAMTAHATAGEKQKCFDRGMNDYISKPFEPLELKKKITELTKSMHLPLKEIPAPEGVQTKPQAEMKASPEKSERKTITKNITAEIRTAILDSPKINLTYLKEIAAGNDTFIIEMIELFLNKTPEALEEMNDCLEKKNWDELRMIAHRIKPSFAYIGMQQVQNALAKIELLSEEHRDSDEVSHLVQEVEIVTKNIFEQLRNELIHLK
jgi:PAS domain S-box-containing protein